VSQPPFVPSSPLREAPTVLSSTDYPVGGVTVTYQRGTNQAHRLVVGSDTGEWYPPRYLASLTSGGVLYAALSDVEYERNGGRLPRVFIATEEELVSTFDVSWTTAVLLANSSEVKTLGVTELGVPANLLFIETISVVPESADGDAVQVYSSLDGADVADVYLFGSAGVPLVPAGINDPDYGPAVSAAPATIAGKAIRSTTTAPLQAYIVVHNDVTASGGSAYTVRIRGRLIGDGET